MKAVILAGGLGTRIAEETVLRPKPMIEIGGKPILWHIMKIYSTYGVYDFIICCGYKGYMIKEYFANYFLHTSDITFDMVQDNKLVMHNKYTEPWRVTLVDTGENTMTGGRLKSVYNYIKDDDKFCFTYGDGVADIDISALIKFHDDHGKMATLTAAFPPARFGVLDLNYASQVLSFKEKPKGDGSMINAGFFVLSPKVVELIENESTIWEKDPLEYLANHQELYAYKHYGFWQPMDTLRDKIYLESLWQEKDCPWRKW
jgi:glucose-1-phosphate cytidylyltransferase